MPKHKVATMLSVAGTILLASPLPSQSAPLMPNPLLAKSSTENANKVEVRYGWGGWRGGWGGWGWGAGVIAGAAIASAVAAPYYYGGYNSYYYAPSPAYGYYAYPGYYTYPGYYAGYYQPYARQPYWAPY